MDEQARSQLNNLMLGLYKAEKVEDFRQALGRVVKTNGTFAPDLQRAIDAVLSQLPQSGSLSETKFKEIAKRLLKAPDRTKQQAGRSITWALEAG